jgi:hypothetical protein
MRQRYLVVGRVSDPAHTHAAAAASSRPNKPNPQQRVALERGCGLGFAGSETQPTKRTESQPTSLLRFFPVPHLAKRFCRLQNHVAGWGSMFRCRVALIRRPFTAVGWRVALTRRRVVELGGRMTTTHRPMTAVGGRLVTTGGRVLVTGRRVTAYRRRHVAPQRACRRVGSWFLSGRPVDCVQALGKNKPAAFPPTNSWRTLPGQARTARPPRVGQVCEWPDR